jgi:hypothetical protein
MREVTLSTEPTKSTDGLLQIMDDIARVRAVTAPPIADGGYRMLNVRSERPRPNRAAHFASVAGRPMRVRGFLTAVFAGGLGLAVLAGPVTCPTCDPLPANAERDVERIVARLNYATAPDETAASDTQSKPAADSIKAESGEPPAEVAMVAPEKSEPTISTSALAATPVTSAAPATDPLPSSPPKAVPETKPESASPAVAEPAPEASAASEPAPATAASGAETKTSTEAPQKLEEVPAGEAPSTEVAAATIDSEPVTPPAAVADTPRPLSAATAEDNYDPAPEVRTPRRHIGAKPRAAKVRRSAPRTAAPKLYSSNKYHATPSWAAKMYETPWQNKAFAFQ